MIALADRGCAYILLPFTIISRHGAPMRFALILLCACLLSVPVFAADEPPSQNAAPPAASAPVTSPAPATKPVHKRHKTSEHDNTVVDPTLLSSKDTADITRIEDYLNGLKSISADFIQLDDNGGMMRGKIEIQRPGKMRVTYDPPSKDFIVADGDFVHIWNDDLKEQTNVEEGSSLAEFILRDPVKLSGDITITKFERFPAKLELTLMQTSDPAAGSLTLIFEDHPLILRQWRVVDAQGHTTGVDLQNEQMDVSFKDSIFDFVPPNFGKNPKAQMPGQ
jgi:outer membrane lipoprotein-sorting protein